MPELLSRLADLGASAAGAFWAPVLAWTLLALAVDSALRASGASPRVGLAARGSLLALLPLSLFGPPLLARWVPSVRAPLAPEAIPALPAVSAPLPAVPEASAVAQAQWLDVALGGASVLALASGVVGLLVLGGGLAWISRFRQRLAPADPAVSEAADRLAGELGLTAPVPVARVSESVSPFTVGWRRPLVALPSDLDADTLDLVLAHELAHVQKGHFGGVVAERIVRALFVWHPLVHRLGRGLALDREREADAAVVRLWPERAAEYGRLLFALTLRPSPRFALGASTSPLLSRLHAMTNPIPDRPIRARLVGALLLVVPLVASAAAQPEFAAAWPAPAPQIPASPAAPAAPAPAPQAPEAPETPQTADEPAAPEAPDAPEAPVAAPADTLTKYLYERQVWERDGRTRVRLKLTAGATYEIGEAIADLYSDGGEEGELLIVGPGFEIARSSIRADALPPAPPSPQPPPPPPATPSDEDLARYADRLADELRETEAAFRALSGPDESPLSEAHIRLKTRLDAVRAEYERLVREQERRRLDSIRREALGGDYG